MSTRKERECSTWNNYYYFVKYDTEVINIFESIYKILNPILCHSERSEESRFYSPDVGDSSLRSE